MGPRGNAEMNSALLFIKKQVMDHFGEEQWQDIGLLTNNVELINSHPRLLRSLGFGDDDYGGHVVNVLHQIATDDPANLGRIQQYIVQHFGDGSTYVSSLPSANRITFAPNVFKVPEIELRSDLVAVMMPFAGFDQVFQAIKQAVASAGLECLRADDIWQDSTFMQDIFNLIFQSTIVISDFSSKNPNVMYETGIAHCLGKTVIPIARHKEDIPSDLRHHRACLYLPNAEGLLQLEETLSKRLRTVVSENAEGG